MLPEILLFGEAGSGKDTVAEMLARNFGSASIAMADPMKRFAAFAFGFDENQLWGPSAERNKLDQRYRVIVPEPHAGFPVTCEYTLAWTEAEVKVNSSETAEWIAEVLGWKRASDSTYEAHLKLSAWFRDLKRNAVAEQGLSPRTMLQTIGTEWGRFIDDRMWIRYAQRTQRRLLSGGLKYDRLTGTTAAPGQKFDFATVTDGRFRNEALEFAAGHAKVIKIFDPDAKGLKAGVQGHASEAEQKTIPDHWFDTIICNDKTKGLAALESAVTEVVQAEFYVQVRGPGGWGSVVPQVRRHG